MKQKHVACSSLDKDNLLLALQSPDEAVRARAVRTLCPCHKGWSLFEEHLTLVEKLKKDPSPLVRAQALHVFEDAGEMQSDGYPTNPREVTNDMLRKKRQSRFAPEDPEERERTGKERRSNRRNTGR